MRDIHEYVVDELLCFILVYFFGDIANKLATTE